MHVAAIARFSGDEDAIESDIATLSQILDRHPQLRCGFTITYEAIDLTRRRPELFEALTDRCEYVRTGLGTIDPTTMPGGVLERVLQLESDLLGRLGFGADVLLVMDPWPQILLPRLARNGVNGLLYPVDALDRPGVVTHLDAVLPVATWADSPASGADTDVSTETNVSTDSDVSTDTEADQLAAVWTTASSLGDVVEHIPQGCGITPSAFFADHEVMGRASLTDRSPGAGHDPDLALLARKTIRLSTRIVDRTADEVLEHVVAAASVLGDPPPAEHRAGTIRAAHERLIAARSMMDRARRRGDDWVKASRVDWNADGAEDLHVELAQLSLVLDLRAGGEFLVLDDKAAGHSLGTLVDGPLGRLVAYAPTDGEIVAGSLRLDAIEEGRDRVAAELGGELAGGRVRCRLEVIEHTLRISYVVDGMQPGRFGPELALALPDAEIRVDGGEWQRPVDAALALEGHRYRLRGDGGRMALISTLTPGSAFIRDVADGVAIWTNWGTEGSGTYELSIDLAP